jgi:hypothetical protein
MGTWGIGVWQDDVAADVIVMFDDLLENGSTAVQAVEGVVTDPPRGWKDEDDEVVQVLALAALAIEHGVLDPQLRDRALALIESGSPMERWTDSGVEEIAARQQLLEQFQGLLRRGVATAEELENVTWPEAFNTGPWR